MTLGIVASLQCYEDILSRNGSAIKDTKRRTWVTRDNFMNMYEIIYKRMVEAGIVEKEDEEILCEAGLPSKYKLTLPEYLLFVDEAGCNMNRLNDGKVRGEVFIVPKNLVILQHQPEQLQTCTSPSYHSSPVQVSLFSVSLSSKVS